MSTGFTRGRSMSIRRRTNKQSASARLSADLSALPLPSIRPFSQLSNISGSSDEKRLRHFTNHIAIPSPSPVHNIMSSPYTMLYLPCPSHVQCYIHCKCKRILTLKGNCSAKLIYGVEEVTGIQRGFEVIPRFIIYIMNSWSYLFGKLLLGPLLPTLYKY